MGKKKIVFYHTDLDGYGVKVAARLHYELRGVDLNDVLFIKADYYGEELFIDKLIDKNIKGYEEEIDEIILGDISVKEEKTAEYLDELSKTKKVILRDHHESAVKLNKYKFAKVREKDDEGILRSGTYWIVEELLNKEYINKHPNLKKFFYLVDMFDTWKWANVTPKVTEAEDLTIMFDILKEEGFDNEIYPKLLFENDVNIFDEKIKYLLGYIHKDLNKNAWSVYFGMRIGTYVYHDKDGDIPLTVGIMSTSAGSSMIAQRVREILKKNNMHVDFLMNVGTRGGIALRADDNCKVPCGLIAEQLTGRNGGGHPGSAGASIDVNRVRKGLVEMIGDLSFDELDDERRDKWNIK